MNNIFKTVEERIKADMPLWFKNIAWATGIIAVITTALLMASNAGTLTFSAFELEWLKRIDIVAVALCALSFTSKK